MGINDPVIKVECDKCGVVDDYDMTALAGGGWDDRNLKRKMTRDGWQVSGHDTYCLNCATPESSHD